MITTELHHPNIYVSSARTKRFSSPTPIGPQPHADTSMPVDLYYIPPSTPSRAVLMLAEAIGLPLNLKLVDLMAREQYRPEFLRMNPAHAVPTIDDDGFYLSESRAILTYLVDKYAAGSSLYPAQPDRRALINQRLQFDLNTLYKAFSDYYYLQMFFGEPADEKLWARIELALGVFEAFLGRSTYAAGDVYTIADISLLATVSSFCHADGVHLTEARWPNVCRWFERARAETKGWHWNEEGLLRYRSFFAAMRAKRAATEAATMAATDAAVDAVVPEEETTVSVAVSEVETTAGEVVEVQAEETEADETVADESVADETVAVESVAVETVAVETALETVEEVQVIAAAVSEVTLEETEVAVAGEGTTVKTTEE